MEIWHLKNNIWLEKISNFKPTKNNQEHTKKTNVMIFYYKIMFSFQHFYEKDSSDIFFQYHRTHIISKTIYHQGLFL